MRPIYHHGNWTFTVEDEVDEDEPWVACYMQCHSAVSDTHETAGDAIGSLYYMADDGDCYPVAVIDSRTDTVVWSQDLDLSIWDAYDQRHIYDAIEVAGSVRHVITTGDLGQSVGQPAPTRTPHDPT